MSATVAQICLTRVSANQPTGCETLRFLYLYTSCFSLLFSPLFLPTLALGVFRGKGREGRGGREGEKEGEREREIETQIDFWLLACPHPPLFSSNWRLCVQQGGRKRSECVIIWSLFSFRCFIPLFFVCLIIYRARLTLC